MNGRRVVIGMALLAAAIVGLAIGFCTAPVRTWAACLAAWVFATSIGLGALMVVMISHVVQRTFLDAFRTHFHALALSLPLLGVAMVVLGLAIPVLFPWAGELSTLPELVRKIVEHKRAYLNAPFFMARSVFYMTLWSGFAVALRLMGRDGSTPRQRTISAAGLVLVGLSIHFAAIDWIASVQPEWTSSMIGVNLFAGGLLGAACCVAILARLAPVEHRVRDRDPWRGLGKMHLAATSFWAYVAYFQFFLIWVANVPMEAFWLKRRSEAAWGLVVWMLILLHFSVPFFLLLQRRISGSPRWLPAVAALLLLMHAVESAWWIVPAPHFGAEFLHPLDAAAAVLAVATLLPTAAFMLAPHALTPHRAPRPRALRLQAP